MTQPTIAHTLQFAKDAHGLTNQFDKGGKNPYHWHLLRVMLRLEQATPEQRLMALLHDVLEDTKVSKHDLWREGYSDAVVEGVAWCSKNMFPQCNFVQWMQEIALHAPESPVKVKLADIFDNLGFERMLSLERASKLKFIQEGKKKLPGNLSKLIQGRVSKQMRLVGEMGVFRRYYQALQIILENPNHQSLLPQVWQDDFCLLTQLQDICGYLTPQEQSLYLPNQRITTWKIGGIGKVLHDRIGNEYLAVDIGKENTAMYEGFMLARGLSEEVNHKLTRDSGHYHVTVVNAAQWSKLKQSPQLATQFTAEFLEHQWNFFSYGIGCASNKSSKTFFTVLENAWLDTMIKNIGLPKHDFHMTLGFNPKDVFGVDKSRGSVKHKNDELWKWFLDSVMLHTPQPTTKSRP